LSKFKDLRFTLKTLYLLNEAVVRILPFLKINLF